jgi:hypothetical protein
MYSRHLPRLYFVEVFEHLQIDSNPCIACEFVNNRCLPCNTFSHVILFYFSTISLWLLTNLLSQLKNHAPHATPITSPACSIVEGGHNLSQERPPRHFVEHKWPLKSTIMNVWGYTAYLHSHLSVSLCFVLSLFFSHSVLFIYLSFSTTPVFFLPLLSLWQEKVNEKGKEVERERVAESNYRQVEISNRVNPWGWEMVREDRDIGNRDTCII